VYRQTERYVGRGTNGNTQKYIVTYLQTYIQTYKQIHNNWAYNNTHILTYIHTYKRTGIQAEIHAYRQAEIHM